MTDSNESMNENPPFENRLDVSTVQKMSEDMKNQISTLIEGQKEMIDFLIASILAGGHVLIEGVPGVAKTLTTRILARTLDTGFSRIQFTPDLMPADVIGTSVFNPKESEFTFRKGPVFSNIVLIDEINRSPAKTQAALFEVMQEQQITYDGITYAMSKPFMVIATQNPIEHEGTYRLPEAQLDRFMFKINVPYPELEEEINILAGHHRRQNTIDLDEINSVVSGDEIIKNQSLVASIHVSREIMEYIAKIVRQSRNHSHITIGASPRASFFVMKAAQAWAAMNGRDFITPDDVKWITKPVLRHRITLTPEREMEGITTDEVIQMIVDKVEVPR